MWSHAALLSNGFLMRESEGGERSRERSSFEKRGEISAVALRALTACMRACMRVHLRLCELYVCARACTV